MNTTEEELYGLECIYSVGMKWRRGTERIAGKIRQSKMNTLNVSRYDVI